MKSNEAVNIYFDGIGVLVGTEPQGFAILANGRRPIESRVTIPQHARLRGWPVFDDLARQKIACCQQSVAKTEVDRLSATRTTGSTGLKEDRNTRDTYGSGRGCECIEHRLFGCGYRFTAVGFESEENRQLRVVLGLDRRSAQQGRDIGRHGLLGRDIGLGLSSSGLGQGEHTGNEGDDARDTDSGEQLSSSSNA